MFAQVRSAIGKLADTSSSSLSCTACSGDALYEMNITFFVRLDESDWNADHGGWSCSAFSIPTAEVQELKAEGQTVQTHRYSVDADAGFIYMPDQHPASAIVRIALQRDLVTANSRVRVAQLGVIGSVLAAAISGMATYYSVPDRGAGVQYSLRRLALSCQMSMT